MVARFGGNDSIIRQAVGQLDDEMTDWLKDVNWKESHQFQQPPIYKSNINISTNNMTPSNMELLMQRPQTNHDRQWKMNNHVLLPIAPPVENRLNTQTGIMMSQFASLKREVASISDYQAYDGGAPAPKISSKRSHSLISNNSTHYHENGRDSVDELPIMIANNNNSSSSSSSIIPATGHVHKRMIIKKPTSLKLNTTSNSNSTIASSNRSPMNATGSRSVTAMSIFSKFTKRHVNELGEDVIDVGGIISSECYEMWLSTRKQIPKSPEECYRKCILAHCTASDGGSQPFSKEVEAALLNLLRKKGNIWPCFAGKYYESGREIVIGRKGLRAAGYHEKLG